jgi:hypothetical protein
MLHMYCNGFDERIDRQRLCNHGPTPINRITGLCNQLLVHSPVNTFQHTRQAAMEETEFSMR